MEGNKFGRLIKLLKKIERGEEICIAETSRELGVSPRTLQRYLRDLEENLNLRRYKQGRGCYRYNLSDPIRHILNGGEEGEKLDQLIMTLAQFHPAVAELFRLDTKFLERCRRNPNIFLIKTSPMEELTNWQMIQQLQKCINRSQKVEIDYYLEIDGGVQLHFAKFKPYRIVLEEGNWYLVGEDGEDPEMPVKALRIGFIRRVNPLPEEFKRKPEIKRFIENRQSLFSTFGRREERALIKVSPEVARFFKKKKFLASQRVVEERQDGLIVEYRFTNSMEILRLVKCWLPHLEVLEPLHLRKEVEVLLYQSLQRYSS